MFGENYMLGVTQVKPDQNGRIFLPKFTGVEQEDILILIQKKDYLEIWTRLSLISILKKLERKMKCASTEEEKLCYLRNFNQINVLIVEGYRKVNCCEQRHSIRVNLGKKLVERYNLSQGAIIEARGSYLRIWNPLKFKEYKDSLGEIKFEQFTSLETTKKLSKIKK